jgi:hypothetical protein
MKRMLLVLSAAMLFLSTFAVTTALGNQGGGSGGQTCNPPTICKP